MYMRSGGVIESLIATDRFGDVGTDDISLRVRTTVSGQSGTRAVYDQAARKIYFFLPSKVLVLFKDMLRGESSPWSIYKTQHPSAFNTDAATYLVSPVSGENTVLFGDDNGYVYDMNGAEGTGDGGSISGSTYEIAARRKMPLQPFSYDQFLEGRVFYRRIAECTLTMTFQWGDERNETSVAVVLKAPASIVGDNNYYSRQKYYDNTQTSPVYYGAGVKSLKNPVSKGFSAMGKGSSVFVTLEVRTSENFEIDYLEV